MSPNKEALSAYTTHQDGQENDRDIDKRVLLTAASRLKSALDTAGSDMPLYQEAIKFNQRVWTMFQVALCEPDNALPDNLKILLLNLSRYIDRTSLRAITQFAPPLVKSLIDINRNLAAGLARKPQPNTVTIDQAATPSSVMISA